MVYLDESGIDKFLSRDYARSMRGKQVICDVYGKKYQRVSMIAAQSGKNVLAPMVFEGTTDAKLFNHWLEKCLVPELKAGQVVIMDNYCIHKTKRTQELYEESWVQNIVSTTLLTRPQSNRKSLGKHKNTHQKNKKSL